MELWNSTQDIDSILFHSKCPHLHSIYILSSKCKIPESFQLQHDILFFVKSLNCITSSFNIFDYVSFCEHSTRSSTHHKLKQSVSCTNKTNHFYFNRLPRLWNSLPTVDLNQPLSTIISELKQFFWNHFITNYDPLKPCTLHYLCPCCKCSVSHSTNFSLLSVST